LYRLTLVAVCNQQHIVLLYNRRMLILSFWL